MGKGKAHRAKDKYYFLAKEQGFRARSAFKLIQLNKKYDFLSKAQVLIDLCAAPGGWLQVAQKYMPVSSLIIGVDLVPIRSIPRVITHAEDITTTQCRSVLKKDMGNHKADVVLHDGAPNVGAAWIKDAYGQSELVLHSLKLASEFLKRGGWFVTKVFRSADYHALLWVFQQLFKKVEATKPHSSRNASAEIFVVCQGFLAPDVIDPKLLNAAYVFKQLEPAKQKLNVLHGKQKQKRNRGGYDESLGQILHVKESVNTFMTAADPVRVLSTVNQLVWDEESEKFKTHKATTPEVLACCDDLRVLGKKDFRGLLKWRALIQRDIKAAQKEEEEANAAAAPQKSAAELAAEEEAQVDLEIQDLAAGASKRRKREIKKAREQHRKQLQRVAMGMAAQAVDPRGDPNLFSLDTFGSRKEMEDASEVNLDRPSRALRRAMAGSDDDRVSSSESEESDLDSEDEAARYQQKLEDELDYDFDNRQSRSAQRTLDKAGDTRKGIRLTRKQRAIEEAKIKEAQAMAKLDSQHQRYLRLLAKAGRRADDSDDDSATSSDDGFSDDPDAPAGAGAGGEDSDSDEDGANTTGGMSSREAAVHADRWFSQPMFQEMEADAAASAVAAGRRGAATFDSDSEEDASAAGAGGGDDSDSDSDAGAAKATKGGKKKTKAVELEPLPLTEREKRKQKHRKQKQKEAARAARKRRRNGDYEVVAAERDAEDEEASDADMTPQQKADRQVRRDMIRAGMGRALTGKDDGDFEVVAAPDSDAESEGPDPRDDAYDSDTHAELLALGKKMRRHTTAKALVDASYNRYSFNDDYLPKWFAVDEQRHFRPQLPITRAEVDEIKRNFRDIAARPVHKVAEARARKRRRLMQNLEKAKAQARTIVNSEDMGTKSKARAIEKAFKRAELKKQATTYVVYRNGRQIARTEGGKGAKTKLVDPRLKADTLGQRRSEQRKTGKAGKKRGKGKSRNGRRKR